MPNPAIIGTTDLRDLLASPRPPRLIDVRTPREFETAHIAGSRNVPLDLLNAHRDDISRHLDDVVLICRSGQRATQAQSTLRDAGLTSVHVLDGGMVAWEQARFAVTRGVERWELERQVRLVAGSLVLSVILASSAVPKLKWVAAGIGGGLVAAAVSNTCAMGMLLAKLPYNRGPSHDLETTVAGLTSRSAVPESS